MIKYALYLLTIWTLLSVPAATGHAGDKESHCIPVRAVKGNNLPYAPGEKLNYTVHYQWGVINADVAKGVLTVDSVTVNGQGLYVMRVTGRTARFYDPFFTVREDFRCWFSPADLKPVRFTRTTKEGKYYAKDEYRYVRDSETPHIAADLDSKTKGKRQMEMPIEGCTTDIISLIASARNLDEARIVPGLHYSPSFAFDDKVSPVKFVYSGKETIKVPGLGKVRAIKFVCQLVEGEQFNANSNMAMWLSDDDNRLPLRFEAPIKYGIVTGYLSSWAGLKHEFSSKID